MKRLQFELPEERVKELDDLADSLGMKTRVRLINAALTLFQWAVRERRKGRVIASVDEVNDTYKEVEIPGFPPIDAELSTEELFRSLFSRCETDEQREAVGRTLVAFGRGDAEDERLPWRTRESAKVSFIKTLIRTIDVAGSSYTTTIKLPNDYPDLPDLKEKYIYKPLPSYPTILPEIDEDGNITYK